MFKDARNDAEERIYSQINDKIDEFFELCMCHIYCTIFPQHTIRLHSMIYGSCLFTDNWKTTPTKSYVDELLQL